MTPNLLPGLISAFLLLSLTACARQPMIDAPDSLLIDTPIPELEGRRQQDLLNWANALRCAIVEANEDKAALRALKAGLAYKPTPSTCETSHGHTVPAPGL